MNYKTYLITFLSQGIDIPALNAFIKNSPYVLSYWNYIPSVYCIKSLHSVVELRAHFDASLQYRMFIIVEINPFVVDGRLTTEAWQWFKEDPYEAFIKTLSPPAAPPSGQ